MIGNRQILSEQEKGRAGGMGEAGTQWEPQEKRSPCALGKTKIKHLTDAETGEAEWRDRADHHGETKAPWVRAAELG